jgi:DNA-binding HxlR family transcriptional regulator
MPTRPTDVNLQDLERTSEVIGRKWTTTLLYHLAQGPLRFGELRRRVEGISEKVLIERLRELEGEGLVSRHVEATVPPQVEYRMTAHGRTLCPVIEEMAAWGGRHRKRSGQG